MKKMKRIFAVLVAFCLTLGMMNLSAFVNAAASTAAGTYGDPHVVNVGGDSLSFNLLDYSQDTGYEAYVVPSTADLTDEESTLPSNFATVNVKVVSEGTDWFVQYGRFPVYPVNGVAEFTMEANAFEFFTVVNNDATKAIAVSVTMTQGEGGGSTEPTGTMDNPIILDMSNGFAQGSKDVEYKSSGVFFKIVALEDGVLDIGPGVMNGHHVYAITNLTKGIYGDYHYSSNYANDEDAWGCYYNVSKGDEILVWVNSYNPNDEFNAPADTVYINVGFEPVGSYGCPCPVENGEYTIEFVADAPAYYLIYNAVEAGTLTIEMLSDNWMYMTVYEKVGANYPTYGEYYYSNDSTPVPTQTFEMVAGESVTLMIMPFDPANPYSSPAGTVKVGFNFVSKVTKEMVEDIEDVKEGGTYEIEITEENTVVSVEVLEAAKENGVNLEIVADGYKWVINASDIGNDLVAIDFEVVFHDFSIVPIPLIDALNVEDYGTFSIAHDGEFGLDATLVFVVDTELAGKEAKLYYYDALNDKLVEAGVCTVTEAGTIEFEFEHASDYVVTFATKTSSEQEPTPTPNPNPTPDPSPAPDTGDVNVLVLSGLFTVALAGLFVFGKKSR